MVCWGKYPHRGLWLCESSRGKYGDLGILSRKCGTLREDTQVVGSLEAFLGRDLQKIGGRDPCGGEFGRGFEQGHAACLEKILVLCGFGVYTDHDLAVLLANEKS